MFRLESKVDTKSQEYRENYEHFKRLVAEYKSILKEVQQGGPPPLQGAS